MSVCLVCWETFTPTRRGHVFCSFQCSHRARWREKNGLPISDQEMESAARRKRLAPEEVEEIRALLAEGISQRDIAEAMGCSQTAVSNIKLGRTWNK